MGPDDTATCLIDCPPASGISSDEAQRLTSAISALATERGFDLATNESGVLVSETYGTDALSGRVVLDPTFAVAGRAFLLKIRGNAPLQTLEVSLGLTAPDAGWSCDIDVGREYEGIYPNVDSGPGQDEARALAHVASCLDCLVRLSEEPEAEGPAAAVDHWAQDIFDAHGIDFSLVKTGEERFVPGSACRPVGGDFLARFYFAPSLDDPNGESCIVFTITRDGSIDRPDDQPGFFIALIHDGDDGGWRYDFGSADYHGPRPDAPMGYERGDDDAVRRIILLCVELFVSLPTDSDAN